MLLMKGRSMSKKFMVTLAEGVERETAIADLEDVGALEVGTASSSLQLFFVGDDDIAKTVAMLSVVEKIEELPTSNSY